MIITESITEPMKCYVYKHVWSMFYMANCQLKAGVIQLWLWLWCIVEYSYTWVLPFSCANTCIYRYLNCNWVPVYIHIHTHNIDLYSCIHCSILNTIYNNKRSRWQLVTKLLRWTDSYCQKLLGKNSGSVRQPDCQISVYNSNIIKFGSHLQCVNGPMSPRWNTWEYNQP